MLAPGRAMSHKECSPQSAQSIPDTIALYKAKCFLGEFKTAETVLATLPTDCFLNPAYASEIARMRIRQGAYISAAEVLDRALQQKRSEPDKPEWILIEIQRRYLSIHLEGTLRESAEICANIWRLYFEKSDIHPAPDIMVTFFLRRRTDRVLDCRRILLFGNTTLGKGNR